MRKYFFAIFFLALMVLIEWAYINVRLERRLAALEAAQQCTLKQMETVAWETTQTTFKINWVKKRLNSQEQKEELRGLYLAKK